MIAEYVAKPERRLPKPDSVVSVLAGALGGAIDHLDGRENEISLSLVTELARDLRNGWALVKRLLALREVALR